MSIQLDTTRLAGSIQMSAPDLPAPTEQGKALAALLGGASLTVTSAEMSDLEALVAKLKSDSERTRFLMLMTSLTSIGQSLDEAQKSALESGLALAEKLSELEGDLKGYTDDEAKTKAEMAILEAKIDQLKKMIEQAVEDGKDHNKMVEEQKLVREELVAKEKTMDDIQGKIAKTKNEIAEVKGKISAIVKDSRSEGQDIGHREFDRREHAQDDRERAYDADAPGEGGERGGSAQGGGETRRERSAQRDTRLARQDRARAHRHHRGEQNRDGVEGVES